MRTLSFKVRLLLPVLTAAAALVPAGCTGVGEGRGGVSSKIRTIASVGDRPLPVVTGPPGQSVAADREEPPPRSAAEGQVSGRVVDAQGNPVPNARVRLAVGGASGGKLVRATTDDAGGFTLHGLRPGAAYTLIAEADDPQGLITGRSNVRAPDAQVQIHLRDLEDPPPASSGGVTPGRRVNPVSNRGESDDEADAAPAPARRRRINEEDLPPAPEAEALAPASADRTRDPERAANRVPRLAAPVQSTGWRRGGEAGDLGNPDDPAPGRTSAGADEPEVTSALPAAVPGEVADDEGPNPLPPAIEPGRSFRPASTPVPPRSEPEPPPAQAPSVQRREALLPPAGSIQPADAEPAGTPAAAEAPARETAAPAPTEPSSGSAAMPEPAESASSSNPPATQPEAAPPAAEPVPAEPPAPAAAPEAAAPQARNEPGKLAPGAVLAAGSQAQAQPPQRVDWDPPYDPFAIVAAAAPPLTAAQVAPPVARAVASRPAAGPPLSARRPAAEQGGGVVGTGAATPAASGPNTSPTNERARLVSRVVDKRLSTCYFDSRHQRLVDFRLPDLQGHPVRFQELDADLILLDFWGTWCSYCTRSIPHLVELQKQLGPQHLKVVGIAYEEGPIDERVKAVTETAQKLGMNYTVLLGGLDGPCPLQAALHVQAYPTLVLVDRYGRVLWRDSGANPTTLARLDRVLAAAGRGDHVRR